MVEFQSTRPRGARLRIVAIRHQLDSISIHAPAWGATISSPISGKRFCNFNPRARVGRDSPICLPTFCGRHFNPRARVGRDAGSAHQCGWQNIFQSTRPRGARRWQCASMRLAKHISIHAPAWGATVFRRLQRGRKRFQSTRPRGARRMLAIFSILSDDFNPRARVGRDDIPPRARQRCMDFNPRARVGRDTLNSQLILYHRSFQSTRPRGARREKPLQTRLIFISIHAPAWGATRLPSGRKLFYPISIHAPAWGATTSGSMSSTRSSHFNPRARVGRDLVRPSAS